MNFVLWLAQATPTPQEGVDLASKLADAGVAAICLFIAGLAVVFAYLQMKKNNTLEQDFRERIDEDARAMRTEQAALLREMIASEKASREAVLEANKSVETFERTLNGLCEQVSSLKTIVDAKADLVVDEVRRLKP
jgi:uncharacterized protein HemX